MNHIPIFLSSNDNYALFVATIISSICYNTKSFCNFYILDSGITDKNQKKINSLKNKFNNFSTEFIRIDVNVVFKGFKELAHLSLSTYNRLLITEIKPNLGKVLYLDSDMIAIDDIKPLFDTDLGNHLLCAVPDTFPNAKDLEERLNTLKLDKNHKYFNAGVLLFDIQK